MTREDKLAKISEHVQVHVFSVNYLPSSKGKANSEFVQCLLIEFHLHSDKGCDLNYIYDKVKELLNQLSHTMENVFIVTFSLDPTNCIAVNFQKLNEIRHMVWKIS